MRRRASVIPTLLIVRNADVDRRIVIQASSSGMKNFLVTKFGLNLRLVLRFENETLLPEMAFFPVS